MGGSPSGKDQLVVRWRMIKRSYGMKPARAKTKLGKPSSNLDHSDISKFLHTGIILDTLTAYFYLHLRPQNNSKGGLFFTISLLFTLYLIFFRITYRLWILRRIITWSQVGSWVLGRKMSCAYCLWAVGFVSAGEEAGLPTSSPLKSSWDLVPQMYLILGKLMRSLLAWVKLSGSSGIVIPSPHYFTVYCGFLYEI